MESLSTDMESPSTDMESPSTNMETSSSNGNNCTSGFVYDQHFNVCYIIGHPVPVNFTGIRNECKMLNSELVRIISQAKDDWVVNLLGKRSLYEFNRKKSLKILKG
jgi:hypothetical protein